MFGKKEDAHTSAPTDPAPDVQRLTPHEWAERKGLITKLDPARPWIQETVDVSHAAADQLHGWTHHAYNYQGEDKRFLITEEDYDAARKAAMEYPAGEPHEKAIAPNCPHREEFAQRKLKAEQVKAAAEQAAKEERR